MNSDTSLSLRDPREILSEYFCRPTEIQIEYFCNEVLATTQTSDVKPSHGTKALIWGIT